MRSNPMEKPTAGTRWPRNLPTISSQRPPPATAPENAGHVISNTMPVQQPCPRTSEGAQAMPQRPPESASTVLITLRRVSPGALSAHSAAASSSENAPPCKKSVSACTASGGICFSVSSAATPGAPSLSNLSKLMHTESSASAGNPKCCSIPRSRRRSLIFTVKPENPIESSARAVTSISSTSALGLSSPKISISHCTNSRRRPFCGRSARYTRSVWITLNGAGSASRLAA